MNIGIIGLGNLGKRTLEAFLSNGYENIYIKEKNVDIQEDLIQKYNLKIINGNYQILDFIHLATPPKYRCELLMELIINESTFLLIEKPISSNLEGLNRAKQIKDLRNKNWFVNCNRRAFPIHHAIKSRIEGNIFSLKVESPGLNCLSNISHFIDLFRFYGVQSPYQVISRKEEIDIISTKRKDVFDINQIEILFDSGEKLSLVDKGSDYNETNYLYTFKSYQGEFQFLELSNKVIKNTLFDTEEMLNLKTYLYHSEMVTRFFEDFQISRPVYLPQAGSILDDSFEWISFAHKVFNIKEDRDLPIA